MSSIFFAANSSASQPDPPKHLETPCFGVEPKANLSRGFVVQLPYTSATHLVDGSLSPTGGAIVFATSVVLPESFGTVRIPSTNPNHQPVSLAAARHDSNKWRIEHE